jgi:hypothetical protein
VTDRPTLTELADDLRNSAEVLRRDLWASSRCSRVADNITNTANILDDLATTTTAYPFGEDGPKMVRETLCVAQSAIRDRNVFDGRTDEHCARIGRLIDICDVHRPIGPNGKHGKLHTDTCGCDDLATTATPQVDDDGSWQATVTVREMVCDENGRGFRIGDHIGWFTETTLTRMGITVPPPRTHTVTLDGHTLTIPHCDVVHLVAEYGGEG